LTEHTRRLTIDEAVSEFHALVRDQLDDAPMDDPTGNRQVDPGPPETPQEAETRRFLMAQYLLGLACPAPTACRDYHCRRDSECRHLARVKARWSAGRSSHPRRPPGADALRYAIWVYMSSLGGERASREKEADDGAWRPRNTPSATAPEPRRGP